MNNHSKIGDFAQEIFHLFLGDGAVAIRVEALKDALVLRLVEILVRAHLQQHVLHVDLHLVAVESAVSVIVVLPPDLVDLHLESLFDLIHLTIAQVKRLLGTLALLGL